jgi:nucleoside-diphosphate-sugar epimerase
MRILLNLYQYRLNLMILRPAMVYGPGALLGLSMHIMRRERESQLGFKSNIYQL